MYLTSPIDGCPVIAMHPADQRIAVGGRVVFKCQATGAVPLMYSWLHNGVDIPDQHNMKLEFIAQKHGPHGPGEYTCIVENEFGKRKSESAKLTVGKCNLAT